MGYWQRTHQELGRLGTLAQSTMLTWGHSNPRMGEGWGAQETQRASGLRKDLYSNPGSTMCLVAGRALGPSETISPGTVRVAVEP